MLYSNRTKDQPLWIADANRRKCRYDIRIWQVSHQEWDYIVLSEERSDNEGMSVTNNASGVANAVLLMLLPSDTDASRVAFYERLPLSTPEQADRVFLTVARVAGDVIGYQHPTWKYGTLSAFVELIGETLAEES